MEVKAAKSCTRTTLSSLIRKTKKTKTKKKRKKWFPLQLQVNALKK
jgi:hypothetical protein